MSETIKPIRRDDPELVAFNQIAEILEPFGAEEQCRVLAAAAARLGMYDEAIKLLEYARIAADAAADLSENR